MAETTTITGVGSYTFNNDVAVVEINTVAEDGGTAKYVITVKKVLPENIVTVEDIISKMAVKVNGSTLYGISPGTNASTLINTVVNNKIILRIYAEITIHFTIEVNFSSDTRDAIIEVL